MVNLPWYPTVLQYLPSQQLSNMLRSYKQVDNTGAYCFVGIVNLFNEERSMLLSYMGKGHKKGQ
jgi:hypothetical protein